MQQTFYDHYTNQPALAGIPAKNWRITWYFTFYLWGEQH